MTLEYDFTVDFGHVFLNLALGHVCTEALVNLRAFWQSLDHDMNDWVLCLIAHMMLESSRLGVNWLAETCIRCYMEVLVGHGTF